MIFLLSPILVIKSHFKFSGNKFYKLIFYNWIKHKQIKFMLPIKHKLKNNLQLYPGHSYKLIIKYLFVLTGMNKNIKITKSLKMW